MLFYIKNHIRPSGKDHEILYINIRAYSTHPGYTCTVKVINKLYQSTKKIFNQPKKKRVRALG